MPLDDSVALVLGQAMTSAQVGRVDDALEHLRTADEILPDAPSEARAALLGVHAFTALAAGDREAVSTLAERCVATARSVDAPGWETFALTLRVESRVPSATDAGVLEDLLAAENALKRTTDPSLRSWGHTGLGQAYSAQRLFELALPHQEAALDAPQDPFGLRETRMIPLYNLALTHLWWADELAQLAVDEHVGDVHTHRDIAAALAAEAVDVAEQDHAEPFFVLLSRMLRLSAGWEEDPAAAREALELALDELVALGLAEGWSPHAARLAEVLEALGDSDRARAVAQSAVDALPPQGQPQSEAYVRHTALLLAAAGGDASAESGLQYARVIARSWWSQRISRFESMRRALSADEMRRRHDHEHRSAREDPLTRVGNLRAFEETMATLRDAHPAERGEVAMITLDVDRFKQINDRFGHIPGDETLRAVADVVLAQTRGIDLVCRVGGDEFVVVLSGTDRTDCDHVAERLLGAVAALAQDGAPEHLRDLSVSLGAASTSEDLDLDDLRDTADQRMYTAKRRRQAAARAQSRGSAPEPSFRTGTY
ncbi:diguanylate cyclase [Solicola sp. PLA-1-18]|uniref:GGDEF domain-containing protein n=1 Tax=Solicola sp. PLA-1-18 TaxID=3380532 RepID=UPI003B76B687